MFSGWHDRASRPRKQHQGPVLTAQIDWELMALVDVYNDIKPMLVLEIGSQNGGTLYYWLRDAPPGAVVVNIDIFQNMEPKDAKIFREMWHTWAPFGITQHTLEGRSDDPAIFAQAVALLPEIDFLFIDACHTYEGARYDFLKYGPLVRKGGVIAFHDLITPDHQQHIQVGKLWREIQAAGYKTQELRANAPWGGVGIVWI